MGILKAKPTEAKTQTMSFRIPAELANRITKVKADAEAKGFEFDTVEIVIGALDKAATTAERELAAHKSG